MSGFQFRKRIPIVRGLLDLNIGKRSRSWTWKFGPFHYTTSSTGRRTESARIGDGLSWRKTTNRRNRG